MTVAQVTVELRAIFRVHNPGKLTSLPVLLSKFRGKEQRLLANVRKKYGVAPVPSAKAQPRAKAATCAKAAPPLGSRAPHIAPTQDSLHHVKVGMTVAQVTVELRAIFRAHNPGKLASLPVLLSKFRGREQGLLANVRKKYGIAKPQSHAKTAPCVKAAPRVKSHGAGSSRTGGRGTSTNSAAISWGSGRQRGGAKQTIGNHHEAFVALVTQAKAEQERLQAETDAKEQTTTGPAHRAAEAEKSGVLETSAFTICVRVSADRIIRL